MTMRLPMLATTLALVLAALCVPRLALAEGPQDFPPDIGQSELRRPRLLLAPDTLRRLRQRVAGDSRLGEIARAVRLHADAIMQAAPVERKLEGRRLLGEHEAQRMDAGLEQLGTGLPRGHGRGRAGGDRGRS